jgi:hypothetical protein
MNPERSATSRPDAGVTGEGLKLTPSMSQGLDEIIFFLLPHSGACDNLNPMLCVAHFAFRIAQIRPETWK